MRSPIPWSVGTVPHVRRLLQHVDAGPPVRRIQHQMHGSVRFEDPTQGCEPGIRICEMMENSGADNLIEACP